jgi:hypothetical protein
MAITLNTAQPNNADWNTQFQFNDGETGDLIDFTGADIQIVVKDHDRCIRITASTDNGMISIVSTGIFELDVPAASMECLHPGSYEIGGVYSLNGDIISLFTGSLSVISGVARL